MSVSAGAVDASLSLTFYKVVKLISGVGRGVVPVETQTEALDPLICLIGVV